MEPRALLQQLIKEMAERKASDLHIGPGFVPMLRILGELEPSRTERPLPDAVTRQLAQLIMGDRLTRKFEEKLEVDMAFSVSSGDRFRANIFTQRGGVNIALRAVPSEIPTIASLGLPSVLLRLSELRRGLVLVSGATGSGKSTTLAAMINSINATRKAHIITIEDPIEFVHRNNKSIVNQRELGLDTLTYHDALRNILRQDPNVILIGEMRDPETMAAAITSAQTGHLVLSTIHTTDTLQIVGRILDMFPPHQQELVRMQLAETLKGAASQRLLPLSDDSGRVAAVEVMVVTPHIRKAIEDNNMGEVANAVRQGRFYGMQTFNQALVTLYNEGKIRIEDAQAASSNPEEFMLSVRGIETGAGTGHTYEPQA
jgi:twitching motility protein PilT